MRGIGRLSVVTALVLAMLLVAGSVMSAAAKERGDRDNRHEATATTSDSGRDHGNAFGRANRDSHEDRDSEDDDDDAALVTGPARVTAPGRPTEEARPQRPGWGCGDDNHEHLGPPGNPDMASPCDRHDDEDQMVDSQQVQQNQEDHDDD